MMFEQSAVLLAFREPSASNFGRDTGCPGQVFFFFFSSVLQTNARPPPHLSIYFPIHGKPIGALWCWDNTAGAVKVNKGRHKMNMRLRTLGMDLQVRLKLHGLESRSYEGTLFPFLIHRYFNRQSVYNMRCLKLNVIECCNPHDNQTPRCGVVLEKLIVAQLVRILRLLWVPCLQSPVDGPINNVAVACQICIGIAVRRLQTGLPEQRCSIPGADRRFGLSPALP